MPSLKLTNGILTPDEAYEDHNDRSHQEQMDEPVYGCPRNKPQDPEYE